MSLTAPEPPAEEQEYYKTARETGVPVIKQDGEQWYVYTVVGKFYADDEEGAKGLQSLFRRENL